MSPVLANSPEGQIGILTYFSKAKGIGGFIKDEPKDFLVEEITPEGIMLEIGKSQDFSDGEGEYTHFTLQKENWDTIRAIKEISRRLGASHKRVKFAGTKDRRSVSTQRVSVWNTPKERLEKVKIKDIILRDFSISKEPVNLGNLKGNRFTVNIKDVKEGADKEVEKIVKELDGKTPNFFGTQRFGGRLNNHMVGKHLLKGEFKEAVMAYLCDTGSEPAEATAARQELRKTGDFKKALKDFPNYLGFEKSVLNRLVVEQTNFIGSLRALPKKLRWMMVHAYQGYVFNLALSDCIQKGDVQGELPLVGQDTKPEGIVAEILKKEGFLPENFKVPSMPELSLEGGMRQSMVPFSDFEVLNYDKDNSTITLRFSLPPGAYATVLLRELIK